MTPVVEMPLPHAPGGAVGFSTSLLSEDGNDRPHTRLGGIQTIGDEHDPTAYLLELVQDQADVSHPEPGEPVELGDVERLDLACEEKREGVVEAPAPPVLAPGDIQFLELDSGGISSWLRSAASWPSRLPAGSGPVPVPGLPQVQGAGRDAGDRRLTAAGAQELQSAGRDDDVLRRGPGYWRVGAAR
jgi:hypothetical protein